MLLLWWLRLKQSACNAGDLGSIPGLGRSHGEGNGNPLQYSCLQTEQPGRLHTVHGVSKSQTGGATNSLTFFHNNKAEQCSTWLKGSIVLHIWQEFSIWRVLNFWEIYVLFLAYFSTYNSLCSLSLKFLIIWSLDLNLASSIFTFLSSFPNFLFYFLGNVINFNF